jgi:rare lipoprotein A (peptidoglycan hydrolase)
LQQQATQTYPRGWSAITSRSAVNLRRLILLFMFAVSSHSAKVVAEGSSAFIEETLKLNAPAQPARQNGSAQAAQAKWPPGPWRTVVVPAPLELPPAVPGLAPRSAAVRQPIRPLTGYAHELGGLASYYWQDQMTSSGERFNRHGHTAAHKTLPLGTRVRVTNLANGKSTIVRINDRGPFKPGRVIDLSEAAAADIAMKEIGLVRVAIEVVQ